MKSSSAETMKELNLMCYASSMMSIFSPGCLPLGCSANRRKEWTKFDGRTIVQAGH